MKVNKKLKMDFYWKQKITLYSLAVVFSFWNNRVVFCQEVVDKKISYSILGESGFLSILNHRIQFSKNNTYFDYVEDGAQNTLFATQRFTVDLEQRGNFILRFVYQPIDLVTKDTLEEELTVDNVSFAAGTPMEFRYSFPYYRTTYLWNFCYDEDWQLYAGLGLQLRNASIEFTSQDGSTSVSNGSVGPVPLFAFLGRYRLTSSTFIAYEVEGNYANTSLINGDDDDGVRGAILDTALSVQSTISENVTVYAKFRYLSGGAEGTSDDKNNPTSDGYNSNWIDLIAFTLGVALHLENW